MKHLLLIAILLSSGAYSCFAEKPGTDPGQADAPAVLWRVEAEGGSVLLAGSVHLLRPADLPVSPAYGEAFEEADEVVFEIDVAETKKEETSRRIRDLGSLPSGETLADHLGAGTLSLLREYLEELGRPHDSFDGLKPGMVLFSIGTIEAMRMGARPNLGLEEQIYEWCLAHDKPTRGLETIEYQLTLFDSLPAAEVDAMLVEALGDVGEKSHAALDQMIESWKTGDVDRLTELIDEQMPPGSTERTLLLTRRNANWIPEIEAALESGKVTLFLMGAAHLVGDDSVIRLLRERGWNPERVKRPDAARTEGEPAVPVP